MIKPLQTLRATLYLVSACLIFVFCNPAKKTTTNAGNRPGTAKPSVPSRNAPMDTVRWTPAPNAKPPIGAPQTLPGTTPYTGQTYRLAYLLPFLTDQVDSDAPTVPEKSRLALQFYAGAQLALQKLSTEEGLNLSVDVFDTHINDADFQRVLGNSKLDQAQVIIGPIRTSHVRMLADRIKKTHQILLSPESPEMDLTAGNPDFIQVNPSLRAHCAAITRYVRAHHKPEAVTLVCKEREVSRLAYFKPVNTATTQAFAELVVPDATANFDKIDLKPYLRPGRTAVFILPSWASQDFIMAFFRKLRSSRGSVPVEVYGMPQWANFENIEPEYFSELDVHISSADYIDYKNLDVTDFQQAFYEKFGTLPDEDAFNGYDVTLMTGKMLKKYGLSFPEYLAQEDIKGLHADFRFAKVFPVVPADSTPDTGMRDLSRFDYQENSFVHILAFRNYQFVPAR